MSPDVLIAAENITLRGNENLILDNVSLELARGDFVTLVGPNGAGKSCLLRCLLKLTTPDSGSVKHASNVRIGYVPERLSETKSMPLSVARFLHLNQKPSEEVLRLTEINNLLARPLATLSRGELQRVLLARALSRSPDLLILDEPAQNLDINGQLHFYHMIDEIYKTQKLAILMVSHDLHLVMSSTHKVVCLYHHICCSGAPENVRNDPAFVALFGDDMSRLMAVYNHSHSHEHEH